MSEKYDAVIIGGGAAGLFCGVVAAKNKLNTVIIEKEKTPGRKLSITGKGRCNLTNECPPQEFLKGIRTNSKFMQSSIYGFSPEDTISFFESLGLKTVTERGRRVFPVTQRAQDVANTLIDAYRDYGGTIIRDRAVLLDINEGKITGLHCNKMTYSCDTAVIATGGVSYPATGSTGDGYILAAKAGHTVVEPRASLVPLECGERFCSELEGLSLRNVVLTITDKKTGKKVFSQIGEMIFTRFGVSGPLVLSASAYITEDCGGYELDIDLKPGLTEEKLEIRMLRDLQENASKQMVNAVSALYPKSLVPVILERSGIDPSKRANQLTKQERRKLIETTKKLKLSITSLRPVEEAIVTAGGVNVREIDPKTMESKIVKGLYFAGELIDVDGFTGGYNLQIAFSTAYAAANAIIKNKVER